jgi:hypothetical protein
MGALQEDVDLVHRPNLPKAHGRDIVAEKDLMAETGKIAHDKGKAGRALHDEFREKVVDSVDREAGELGAALDATQRSNGF